MKPINIKIKLLGYWYIGTGHEAGAYADSVVLKDHEKLPFIPGKTLKGMFRNSFTHINKSIFDDEKKNKHDELINLFFGRAGVSLTDLEDPNKYDSDQLNTNGILCFNNAELTQNEKQEILGGNLTDYLYTTVQSTKIGSDGIAENKSLRAVEVCVPLTFKTEIDINQCSKNDIVGFISRDEIVKKIKVAAALITEIGGKRRRGFGRCIIEVLE